MPPKVKQWFKEQPKEQEPELMVEVNGKLVPLSKLPCWKCEWNKDGKAKVY